MPQHASAEKRVRQGARRAVRNKARISQMRTLIKKVRSEKDKAKAEAALKSTVKLLDQMAAKGVIHKNNAANNKSKLTRYVNTLK